MLAKKITPKQLDKVLSSLNLSPKNTPAKAARTLINLKKVAKEQLCFAFVDSASELTPELHRISNAKTKPVDWQLLSAEIVADIFNCKPIPNWGDDGQKIVFTGYNNAPKYAALALVSLQRLLYNARRKCLSQFTRASNSKKRQLGDVFAISWLQEVSRKIELLKLVDEHPLVYATEIRSPNSFVQQEQHRTVGA